MAKIILYALHICKWKLCATFFSLLKSLVHQRRHFSCDLIMHATSNYIIHSQLLLWEKHDQSMLVFCFTINPIVSMNDLCGPRNEVTYICCLEFVLSLNVVYFANPTTKELFDFSLYYWNHITYSCRNHTRFKTCYFKTLLFKAKAKTISGGGWRIGARNWWVSSRTSLSNFTCIVLWHDESPHCQPVHNLK